MRYLIVTVLLTFSILGGFSSVYAGPWLDKAGNELTFLTADSYPYKRLVTLSEEVTIKYKKVNASEIACSVTVRSENRDIQAIEVVVPSRKFSDDALKACLDRDFAIDILKSINI